MSDTCYHAVERLDQALAVLDACRGDALIVAGGTLVVPTLRSRRPRHLLDISNIVQLRGIAGERSECLRLGSLVTCAMLARSELVRRRAPVLAQAALNVGGPQVRTLATIGGNVATRCPRADLLPALLVLEATVTLSGHTHTRSLPLSEFLTESAREDELITAIACAVPRGTAVIQRLGARRALAPAIASVAVLLELNEGRNGFAHARIALGGVAPTAMRAHKVEAVLREVHSFDDLAQALRRAGEAAKKEAAPASDAWASARYRRHVIGVLTERALVQAAREACAS
jgi:CO/xanthine dehydrogenase FAD-binding subunit